MSPRFVLICQFLALTVMIFETVALSQSLSLYTITQVLLQTGVDVVNVESIALKV